MDFNTILYLDTKAININQDDFTIDEANVEGALCKAGVLLCYYGDLAAELDAQTSNHKNQLEQLYAEKALNIRDSAKKLGEKVTEGLIEEKVRTDPDYILFQQKVVHSAKDANKASAFFKAMQRKVDCLTSLNYRQRVQEYRSQLLD